MKLFRIINIIDKQTYRLLLFSKYKTYNIFYISLLKFYYIRVYNELKEILYKFLNLSIIINYITSVIVFF